MWGFWTVETVKEFALALGKGARAAPGRALSFDGLGDAREFPVQATEVAELIPRLMEAGASTGPRRTAIIVQSMLSKMQAGRTHAAENVQIFLSIDEAVTWLGKP